MSAPEKQLLKPPSGGNSNRYEYAPRIIELRSRMTQTELARKLGVTQVSISKWENGSKTPTYENLLKLAEIAQTPGLRVWFRDAARRKARLTERNLLALAGNHDAADSLAPEPPRIPGMRRIPPYVDADGSSVQLSTKGDAIEAELVLPESLFRGTGDTLRAVRVRGDCMLPVIDRGWIVVVDLEVGEHEDIVGSLVAVRSKEGMRIRFLQKLGEEFVLVPQNAISRNPVQLVQPEGPWSILGRVISWIGAPFEVQEVPLAEPFVSGRKFRKRQKSTD